MRRICDICKTEFNHEPATARVETGEFFLVCSRVCLVTALLDPPTAILLMRKQLATLEAVLSDTALLDRQDLQESLAQMRRGEGDTLIRQHG